jgi:hypothetical protein
VGPDFIDKFLHMYLRSDDFKKKLGQELDGEYPVTLTYALERALVSHVKIYMLENEVRNSTLCNAEIGELKRKIDYQNGKVRPMLVAAIGDMLAKAVKEAREDLVKEPNMKDYKNRG